MNLKKVMVTATLPILTGIGGVFCMADELNDAAATVIGTAMRDYYKTLEDSGIKLDRQEFIRGVTAVFNGDTIGGYDAASAEATIRRAVQPQQGMMTAIAPADEDAENAWVAKQADLPRAELLEGGVVLQRLTEGSGDRPASGSTVKVMYTGRLSNGSVFDTTEEPFELPLDRIIPGLARAIEQMRYGGIYRVFIPPSEGYGKEAVMDLIPGNSALDFTIKILVEK